MQSYFRFCYHLVNCLRCLFHILLSRHAFVSKLAVFILIDLVFFDIFFSDLAAFLFCIVSGAKLSFASVFMLSVSRKSIFPFFILSYTKE